MGGSYFGGKKVLIAYFPGDDTIRQLAAEISRITNGDLFCSVSGMVERMDDYDVVFIGFTVGLAASTIISSFAGSYDFKGKTVVPFCTCASTCRDETLQKIVEQTSDAEHLTGLGITDVASSADDIQTWINLINEQWNEQNAEDTDENADKGNAAEPSVEISAPMRGTVNLWYIGNIPSVTQNASNSDGPDFIPNMKVFTVASDVTPKGAVIICPGGAFIFRGVRVEGYSVANMLVSMDYQCFVVNYRLSPYTMQESATDLQRAVRYVRVHAKDYRINAENIALVGFSAGGLLSGEMLLDWQGLKNGTALDVSYRPDALDKIPVSVCAVGMIYSFYGQLSVSINDVETLRAANLPPAFYNWGSNDSFDGQFRQNSDAVREAGCEVETHVLEGYPHGYGTGGNADVWVGRFDAFLQRVRARN